MTDFTAIYVRVSTEEQSKDGVSLAMQRDLCEKYVALHDLPTDTMIYEDAGLSASSMDRPALDKLRSDITSGIVKHVVVFKLDRLTRKTLDLCTLMDEFEKYGIALHGVRDKLDTDTPSGRLVLQIMGAVAEWERETIRDRVKSGMSEVKRQGFHVGAAPYGWEAVSHAGPGQLLLPSSEYPHIADSRKAHDAGMSLAGIGNIVKGQRHPQAGKRIIEAPLVEEMVAVHDGVDLIGYRYKSS